ncbi:STAS domain-containing protein [Nocardiopsis lambiniae]|uniref:Anti-sigma factor antagonist n=1 Tax=Nocardiopsis lambiniae TaxID=3075539 RepID=A0ABU2M8M4_9ACTN|nr:STAS domain-containing protein [Nocardiopsis sp. DSM 44743]MDT0328974.1 STAS domain-containing protein [Nocardiopsis sp. DSM 44743]
MDVPDTGRDRFICDGATVVALGGELDLATAEKAYEAIAAVAVRGCVVVDLSEVAFIDASGVNALINAMRVTTRERHHLALARPPRQLSRILDVLDLHSLLPTHADLASAVAAHAGSRAAAH